MPQSTSSAPKACKCLESSRHPIQEPEFRSYDGGGGHPGIRLEEPDDIERGIAAALAHDGPMLIDAVVNRQELSIPPKITLEMAKGFPLFMVKAMISGHADEVVDLAATNLWR